MIVSFDSWGQVIRASTPAGETLWTHTPTDGIDDAWPVDLDGDGNSEVVVGLNGGGGVSALGTGGRVLWSDRSIGNVWTVTAGPMDDKLRVLTTSAVGQVHVFSVTGERVRDLDARCYATDIRLGDQPFVGGSGEGGSFVATLDPSGWMTKVTDRAGIGALAAAPSLAWIGVSTHGGNVYALRASTGAIEGVASGTRARARARLGEPWRLSPADRRRSRGTEGLSCPPSSRHTRAPAHALGHRRQHLGQLVVALGDAASPWGT